MHLRHALLAAAGLSSAAYAQQWIDLMHDQDATFPEVQSAFNEYWQGRAYERGKGYKVFKRWEWFMEPRTYPSGERPDPGVYRRALKDMHAMEALQGRKSNASWEPMGPYSWFNTSTGYNPGNGRVNCVVVDPTDPAKIYIGTPAGGLWRSENSGASWAPLFTELATLGVSGIAIDPSNPEVLYCATGDGDGADTYSIGVIKSTDGGGIWSTTGLNWQTTSARTTRTLRMHPDDPQILFCATSNGLWRTEDGGDSWAQVAEGSFHDVEFKPDDPGIVYACGDQFFRSLDGGSNFSPITAGLPVADDVNRMRIAVTPADPFRVYVLCGAQVDGGFYGLYRSTDGGSSFTLRSNAPNIFGYDDSGTDSGGQSGYDMGLAVDPNNANTVWAAGINVWKSTNGGTDWAIQSHWYYEGTQPYTHADVHCVETIGGALYCGSDGGIFRSITGGDEWEDISMGLQIAQFYRLGCSATDPYMVIAGAQDNGMNVLFTDEWFHALGADGMEGAIDPSDPTYVYGESQYGGLNRSDDGGMTFNGIGWDITEEGGWVTPFVIDQQQPEVLIAGYQNLWRTTDRGDSWEQWTTVNTSRKVRTIAIAPSNSEVVYYANDMWMRRTLNGGDSWTMVGGSLPDAAISSIALDPQDEETVYVTLSGYLDGDKVFRSTNAGVNWTNISANLPNVPANSIVLQEGAVLGMYVGTDVGVFYTDASLSNWQPYSQGLPKVVVSELEINPASQKLRAATYGRGLWETDLFEPVSAPPTASFTFSEPGICAGDAITFSDASIGAAPGWTWDFPGGTPSSSTEANPEVTYATAGSYTATLTVSNGFGTDDFSTVVPVVVLPNRVDISITFDDYPNENSWTITSDATGQVVAAGGPFAGMSGGSTIEDHVCLYPGCYTFTINDSYGDGICCDNGNGSYTVTNPELGTIVTGAEFTYSESTSFCVSLPVGLPVHEPGALLDVIPLDDEGSYALSLPGAYGPFELIVTDALGRVVHQRHGLAGLEREVIRLGRHAPGVFMVHLWGDGREWSARLVRH